MDVKKRIEIFVAAIIASAFLVSLLDLPRGLVEWVAALGIGFILGGISASIVLALSGEVLQDIEIELYGLSISVFTILTFFVRHVLF